MRCKSRSKFASAVTWAVLACSAPFTFAQAAITRFDIPAQSLANSLRDVGRQANINVLVDPPLVQALQAPALHAEITTDEAITRLLAGTGVMHEFLNEKTVIVARADSPGVIRLAQAGSPAHGTAQEGLGARASVRETLEEVIVTAQKREQRLIDVPISMVAVGSDELQKRQVTDLDDLSRAVPGLAVQSSGSFARRIMLRGVSNTFGSSSLIGLYLDEASVSSVPYSQLDLRTYDLERVEVLRGPQGTLYGEGSVGGTIRFISKDPTFDKFTMSADAMALFTHNGAPGQRLDSVVNVPLGSELGLRVAGTFEHEGGWIDQPVAGRENINGEDLANLRVKGLWQPTSHFSVSAMAVVHRNDASPNRGELSDGTLDQVFQLRTRPEVEDDYEIYNLTLSYSFDTMRLLSATSYIDQEKVSKNIGARFQFTPPPLPRFEYYVPYERQHPTIFSEELRLSSLDEGPWQWTIGGFHRRARYDLADPQVYFGLPGPLPADSFPSAQRTESKASAIFGDTSYSVTERLTLGGGLRYFEDDQTDFIGDQREKFHALNPRIYAQYRLAANLNAYASAAKGFRSGGFNSFNRPSYDPEEVWSYELGAKSIFLDGRVTADAALFFSDYSDYQILATTQTPGATAFFTRNAGDAEIKGIEWALTVKPSDGWAFSLNGNYVQSEFTRIAANASSHAVGDQLDLFPEYGLAASVQRDILVSGRPAFVRADYNRHGRSTYRDRSTGPWYFSESDTIGLLNLNVSVQWNPNVSFSLIGQNLLDDRGYTDPFRIEDNAARSRPRTYGFGVSLAFD